MTLYGLGVGHEPNWREVESNIFVCSQLRAVENAARKMKLNPISRNIEGQRLVVVDDSIVRGTTTRAIVEMLRANGAAEVHMRISSPPYRWPCFYGMDTGSRTELIAANLTIEEIRDYTQDNE